MGVVYADGAIPMWGQWGAVGVLLAGGIVLWRYFVAELTTARKETHEVWDRLATQVIPVLGRAASSADHNATTTERVIGVMDEVVSVIKAERSAKEAEHALLLEERLRVAELRAELAEQRARGHGGG